jgi:uncharacterized protein (DUF2141 family)
LPLAGIFCYFFANYDPSPQFYNSVFPFFFKEVIRSNLLNNTKKETMINLVRIVLFVLVTLFGHAQEKGNAIEVKIHRIDNQNGHMLIGLYDSEDTWLKNPARVTIGKIIDGKSVSSFVNIPDGTYAISVFHDENEEGKLATNFLGIPKEDAGSSNSAPATFGPPKWEEAKFEVKGGTIEQVINL